MSRHGYFSGLLSSVFEPRRPAFATRDGRSIVEQCRALMDARGDTAILALSASILATFRDMEGEARREFFGYLAEELDVDAGAVAERAAAYEGDPSPGNLAALLEVAEPARQRLFRRLNYAEGATADLLGLREAVLREIPDNPDFRKIDLDLVHLFTSWFNRGFLVLRRVDWSTPADILEKIIAYEAVHEINDWDDLRRRIQPEDRRCYAYFHPRVPEDPLIFVEIALTRSIPGSVQTLLSEDRVPEDPEALDTAVFYSISNCQPGLAGISFGEALIKRVVADLMAEMSRLKTFVTLSPIPGLRRWAEPLLAEDAAPEGDALAGLAAHYLAQSKRADGVPRDPVARFHLSNGARIENVVAGADTSPNGQGQSWGAMVNYRYDLGAIEKNATAFASGNRIALSRRVQQLSKQGSKLIEPEVA